MKIPLGNETYPPPLNEYLAVKLIGSVSSSIKLFVKSIRLLYPCTIFTFEGAVTTLGGEFVILRVKLEVTERG